jgi:hypothetical protein
MAAVFKGAGSFVLTENGTVTSTTPFRVDRTRSATTFIGGTTVTAGVAGSFSMVTMSMVNSSCSGTFAPVNGTTYPPVNETTYVEKVKEHKMIAPTKIRLEGAVAVVASIPGVSKITVDGASTLTLTGDTHTLKVAVSGASTVSLKSNVDSARCTVSGVSKIYGLDVQKRLRATASGCSSISATHHRDAKISKNSSGMATITLHRR